MTKNTAAFIIVDLYTSSFMKLRKRQHVRERSIANVNDMQIAQQLIRRIGKVRILLPLSPLLTLANQNTRNLT